MDSYRFSVFSCGMFWVYVQQSWSLNKGSEVENDLLSLMAWYTCRVMILIMTSALSISVGLETGYVKTYLEKAAIPVMIFWKTPLGGNSSSKSFCMAVSFPMFHW